MPTPGGVRHFEIVEARHGVRRGLNAELTWLSADAMRPERRDRPGYARDGTCSPTARRLLATSADGAGLHRSRGRRVPTTPASCGRFRRQASRSIWWRAMVSVPSPRCSPPPTAGSGSGNRGACGARRGTVGALLQLASVASPPRPGCRAAALALVLAPTGAARRRPARLPVSFLLGVAGLSHGQPLWSRPTRPTPDGPSRRRSCRPCCRSSSSSCWPDWRCVIAVSRPGCSRAAAGATHGPHAALVASRCARRSEPMRSRKHVERMLWRLVGGAAADAGPRDADFCRGYTELLLDNLGQPGFRELLSRACTTSTRGSTWCSRCWPSGTGATSSGGDRRRARSAGRPSRSTSAGVGRDHLLDALRAALVLPVATEPHATAVRSGELLARRDPPGGGSARRGGAPARGSGRAAGADQVVVVAASPERSTRTASTPSAETSDNGSASIWPASMQPPCVMPSGRLALQGLLRRSDPPTTRSARSIGGGDSTRGRTATNASTS